MIITSLIFAAVLVYVLRITGAMDLLIRLFSPVMSVFGLPAAAVVALVAGFFSKPGGCATAALLYSQGELNRVHVTILFPAIILMGALVGQYVRIVVASGAERRHHPLMFAICFFDVFLALASMSLAMRLLGRL
jgi:spore maturation protein SpmB